MPERIQLRRTRGWRKPEGAIVVARPSKWGNPWRVGSTVRTEYAADGGWYVREFEVTPEIAVAFYRAAFSPDLEDIRRELAGHDLACWCPLDQPCHADVLLDIANRGDA